MLGKRWTQLLGPYGLGRLRHGTLFVLNIELTVFSHERSRLRVRKPRLFFNRDGWRLMYINVQFGVSQIHKTWS